MTEVGGKAITSGYAIDGIAFAGKPIEPGLYPVATPIGNLSDISLRALDVLGGADLIICEDSRVTAVLLDRYGPRRVEAALLVIAAIGAAVFALADGLTALTLGRALIGLGVSACLMASFKAFTQWFPPERQASLTGWIMASGGLGALAAAKPLEITLGFTGWREIVLGLAAVTLMVAFVLWKFVPDTPAGVVAAGWRERVGHLAEAVLQSPDSSQWVATWLG